MISSLFSSAAAAGFADPTLPFSIFQAPAAQIAATQTDVGAANVTSMMEFWASKARNHPGGLAGYLQEKVLANPFSGLEGPSLWGKGIRVTPEKALSDSVRVAVQREVFENRKMMAFLRRSARGNQAAADQVLDAVERKYFESHPERRLAAACNTSAPKELACPAGFVALATH